MILNNLVSSRRRLISPMGNSRKFISRVQYLMSGMLFIYSSLALTQSKVDTVVNTGIERGDVAAASQRLINKTAEETSKIFANYKRELKVNDGLRVYNVLLQKQLDDQLATIETISKSMEEVVIIERQVTPLMLSMIEGLDQFIDLDVPFLMKERKARVTRLRDTVGRSDVTAAEKFRSVLEAFQIENEYGRTLEAYRDLKDINGQSREVSFLRFGRISLVYQTDGGELNGVWDQGNRQWQPLDMAEHRNHIANGLRIARKQIAPDLVILPISTAEGM